MVRGERTSEAHKSKARLSARKVKQLMEKEEEEEEEECIIMCINVVWSSCQVSLDIIHFISSFFPFSSWSTD